MVVADSGRQALDELERRPVDLLISDIHMPDMTGLDVLRTAKAMNPDLAGIMVTAFASTDTVPSKSGPGSVPSSAARADGSTSLKRPKNSAVQPRARHRRGSASTTACGRASIQRATVSF